MSFTKASSMNLMMASIFALLLLAVSPSMGLPATRLTIGHSTINPRIAFSKYRSVVVELPVPAFGGLVAQALGTHGHHGD